MSADDRLLPVVLTALDGVPLAIELFAAGAQGVSTLTLPWQRWRRERTAMLARGMTPDRLSNLDVSMRASLMGPRMNDCARCLFAMLGRLPSGVAFTDLESLLPGNGADAAMRLVQTRLGSEREGRLVMLGPVRDYARAQELSAEDLARLLAHFERLAAGLTVPFVLRGRDLALKARAEIDNIDALIDGMLRDEDVPANTRYRLALLSLSVGDARLLLGGLPLAAIAYERTLAFVQRLAAADPANTTWQRDLSISGNRIGAVRQAQGDLAGALSAFEDSLVIRAQLAAAEPANTTWQRDLYICWDRIGEVRQRQGDLAGALRAFEDSRVIRARLAATDPANTTWQRDLSIGWSQIGDVLQRQGDLAGALRAFEDSRLIHAQLAATDPADTTCQRDLSICWSRIGEVRRRQGDFAGALRAFEDSRVIAVRLAAADPANTTWQRDLSYCLTKLGEYHEQQGQLGEALRFAEESLGLDERLAALDPTNVTWKKDVEISRAQVARLRR